MKKVGAVCVVALAVSVFGIANASSSHGHKGHKRVCVAGYIYHENGNRRVVWTKLKSGKSFRDHVAHGDRYECTKWKKVRGRRT